MSRIIEYYEINVIYRTGENPMAGLRNVNTPDYLAMSIPVLKNGYFEFTTDEGVNIMIMADKIKSIESRPIYRELLASKQA